MTHSRPVTLSLGEVLWDMLPDGKALGGAPTNVAWHCAQLGADAHVASAVGKDELGDEILVRLRSMNLDVSAVSIIPDKPTSTVDAMISPEGNATYVIHKDVAWDWMPVSEQARALARQAQGLNFGTLSQRGSMGCETTHTLLNETPADCLRIFDINLRPPDVHKNILQAGFEKATVVKMNDAELPVIADMFGLGEEPEAAMASLFESYANLQHIVVTRGSRGVWWHNKRKLYGKLPAMAVKAVDTIGAGDSFTASIMMGLLKGWDVEKIMDAALAVAAFVCTQRGGTPELPASLKDPFLH